MPSIKNEKTTWFLWLIVFVGAGWLIGQSFIVHASSIGKPITQYRVCSMVVGADNGAALGNADLGPQGFQCFIPQNSTILEVDVAANAGTPNVIPNRIRGAFALNTVSSALATAAAGGVACSNVGGTVGLAGTITCSATLQNTSLQAGDWLQLTSGTAGGTASRMSIDVIYSVN